MSLHTTTPAWNRKRRATQWYKHGGLCSTDCTRQDTTNGAIYSAMKFRAGHPTPGWQPSRDLNKMGLFAKVAAVRAWRSRHNVGSIRVNREHPLAGGAGYFKFNPWSIMFGEKIIYHHLENKQLLHASNNENHTYVVSLPSAFHDQSEPNTACSDRLGKAESRRSQLEGCTTNTKYKSFKAASQCGGGTASSRQALVWLPQKQWWFSFVHSDEYIIVSREN